MWEVLAQGDYIPLDEVGREIPKARWNNGQKKRFMLNSKARNALICDLTEEEYTKVHSFKSAKQMWDTLALTYEGSLELGKTQQVKLVGRTYDNFDHIDKLLRCLPRKWRPQVTTLRASKNLEKLLLEELMGLFKVHELELQ
ncbi:uncharacterized protein LOC109793852 [Cajanus cajan]|uniref:uncharacterized protein LOC109793852 n=1 Tax=Cajanus cajan TaxID=3821 RepID=UPI00098D89B6|nr:uncharacterized protein LOC109793852 [Cajanus cajan]